MGGHSEPCRARLYPLLAKDEANRHRFENAEARRQEWSDKHEHGGAKDDTEAKRRRLDKGSVETAPSIQGGDKRDMVRDALGESTAKKARPAEAQDAQAEAHDEDGDVVIQGQTGGSTGSGGASETRRSEDDERVDSDAKRQRVQNLNVIKDSNQRLYKEDISSKSQNQVLNQIKEHSIVELYSPPRASVIAAKFGILSHGSFDITEVDPDDGGPWDFSKKEK